MKIKQIDFNWRQEGSVQDANGAGENYNRYTLGVGGVIEIEELFFEALPNYTVHFENGNYVKIFDPNFVEYVNEQVMVDLTIYTHIKKKYIRAVITEYLNGYSEEEIWIKTGVDEKAIPIIIDCYNYLYN